MAVAAEGSQLVAARDTLLELVVRSPEEEADHNLDRSPEQVGRSQRVAVAAEGIQLVAARDTLLELVVCSPEDEADPLPEISGHGNKLLRI